MITVAYSPDADDAFMFWALETGRIDHGHRFSFSRHDTETLNRRCLEGHDDISAVSVGALPAIVDRYRLLPHGGSIGTDYGPVVVERPGAPGNWTDGPVAIPGERTTAALVLRWLHPGIPTVEVPITPFDEAFACLTDGRARASLLIHEGRLTFADHGCIEVEDIGRAWHERTGLPLALGVNVIRRDLDDALQRELEQLVGRSIREALDHRDEAIAWVIATGAGNLTTPESVSEYLDLYANEDTAGTPEAAIEGIGRLFSEAAAAGLIDRDIPRDEFDGSFWRSPQRG